MARARIRRSGSNRRRLFARVADSRAERVSRSDTGRQILVLARLCCLSRSSPLHQPPLAHTNPGRGIFGVAPWKLTEIQRTSVRAGRRAKRTSPAAPPCRRAAWLAGRALTRKRATVEPNYEHGPRGSSPVDRRPMQHDGHMILGAGGVTAGLGRAATHVRRRRGRGGPRRRSEGSAPFRGVRARGAPRRAGRAALSTSCCARDPKLISGRRAA